MALGPLALGARLFLRNGGDETNFLVQAAIFVSEEARRK